MIDVMDNSIINVDLLKKIFSFLKKNKGFFKNKSHNLNVQY